MGNVSPVARLAKKHGVLMDTVDDKYRAIIISSGQDFLGDTPRAALDAAIATLPPLVDKTVARQIDKLQAEDGGAAKPKKAKKKKAAKKKAKRSREEGEEGDEEEEEEGKEVIKKKYRQKYEPLDHSCGDPMAEAFAAYVRGDDGKVDLAILKQVADDNEVDLKRWAKRNVGMQRMNLGNVLRGKLRHGVAIKIGKSTFKPEKSDAKKA